MSQKTNKRYVPGVCNIGPLNRAGRGVAGVLMLAVAIVAGLTLSKAWLPFLFLPLWAGFVLLNEAVQAFVS